MIAPRIFRADPAPEGLRRSEGRTLPQLLASNAAEFAADPALKFKKAGIWHVRTWTEVLDEVRSVARGFAALGLRRGEVVALISENTPEQFITELAVQSIGAITVCVYPDAPADELLYALDHSGATMALGQDQEQIDKILACLATIDRIRRVVFVEERGLWSYDEPRLVSYKALVEQGQIFESNAWVDARIAEGKASEPAAYCYTSGTTSRPKAAVLSHAFILDNAHRLMGSLNVRPGGNYLSYISPAWAAEQFFGIALPLLAPMIVHFAEKPDMVQSDLREIGPEFLMFTPRQWEMQASGIEARMMAAGRFRQALYAWGLQQGLNRVRGTGRGPWHALLWRIADVLVLKGVRDLLGLTRARAVLSGGAGLSAELFERFRAFGVPLGNLYGSTELGLISTHRPGSRNAHSLGSLMPSDPSIAEPIEAFVDEKGQLRLKVMAFLGYLNDPEATVDLGRVEDGYQTGDAVRIDETGELVFLDRLKDLRNLKGGQSYPPQFIENHLRAASLIRDAIVIGDETRERVVALINVDSEIAGRFAELKGLAYGTFPELSQLAEVRSEVDQAIARVNRLLDPGARIAAFANLPKELDADESELTRSRKLRRAQIHDRYSGIIDALYADHAEIRVEIEVRYQDGNTSKLNAPVAINRIGEPA
ncbi:long-chain fatty acid--CoA ligase [Phreatobacter aquaticus]|uniref:Long-chain fatty acid--CoA ligase n=1 Tax=Phreatobacter aquaticus TaxID=2570229 RepID=A0A4D7QI18_9HYPH|nr:AMP-binding protein [Phreatobacter aquaticus]QCK85373.1 long-chain fatty acid--CoA ligase [Phreatobacter aquaticus]